MQLLCAYRFSRRALLLSCSRRFTLILSIPCRSLLVLLTASAFCQSPITPSKGGSPEIYHPAANSAAVVTAGHARITVLAPQLLRLEWAEDRNFEDRASFTVLNRELPVPAFTQRWEGQGDSRTLMLDTASLHLRYRAGEQGGPYDTANLSITLDVAGKSVVWSPGMVDSGNLMGTTRTLDGVKGGEVQLENGLISRNGWVLVDDSKRPLFDSSDFSLPKPDSRLPWFVTRPAGRRVDWYFFGYGHEYGRALGDFVRISGRIPLPPRFAFGYWWSRYWAYSDQELNELVDGFRTRTLPLDVLVIDMDWHINYRGSALDPAGYRRGWTGYTWNENLFPDPKDFLTHMHDDGLKVTLNLHPAAGVQPHEQAYPEFARAMGQDPAAGKYVPLQLTDPKYIDNYFKLLHHPLERQGIDFWWLDWQQEAHTDVAGIDPTFWLNYLHFSDQAREGKRPMLFHRWGGLGNHRYQIGFSGDTQSVWESLAYQPAFTSNAANVGYAYWSHDIGGHLPGAIEPELYLRWVQFGAFSPILRTHTTRNADAERRPWAYPEPYSDILEDTLRQRYAWIPYIYTEARRTYDTGVAFMRPLYYSWPEQDEAYRAPNEYLFGDRVMVAPVTQPVDRTTGRAEESLWLPPGEWIELSTGAHLVGPMRTTRSYTLEQTPVFALAGSIVPMQPAMLHVGEKPVDPLILDVMPLADGGETSYVLYEDSSEGRDYEGSAFATTSIHAIRHGVTTTVTVDPARGSYPGAVTTRGYQLELPGDWPPAKVLVNGKPTPWRFDGNTLTTTVQTSRISTASRTVITIEREERLVAQSKLLDRWAGRMTDLRHGYTEMNNLWPVNDLVAAAQTGDRISYHPEDALKEIERLPGLILGARKDLDDFAAEQDRQPLKPSGDDAVDAQKAKMRQLRLERIHAALTAAER
jgi:alpha-glucosidase (family GH31 glycosyl hydrolase)